MLFNIPKRKIISILFLLATIFVALAFSNIPFLVSRHSALQMEGFKEGLLSTPEQKKITEILDQYSKDVESESELSKTKLESLAVDDSVEKGTLNSILKDTNLKSTSMIDKIVAQGLKNKGIVKILDENSSKRYTLTKNMINDIKALEINDDKAFSLELENQLASPQPTGPNSSYLKMKEYLNQLNEK